MKNWLKFLLAVIIAIVALGIITGLFQTNLSPPYNPCVSNPINELVTKIQAAETGIITATDTICMQNGEKFNTEALTSKIPNLDSISLHCTDAAVCKNSAPLKVTLDSIEAVSEVRFKGLVECQKQPRTLGNYTCTIVINNA